MYIPVIYDRLAELAFKKVNGILAEDEANELNGILESSTHKKQLFDEMMDPDLTAEAISVMMEFDVDASWKKVKQDFAFKPKKWSICYWYDWLIKIWQMPNKK